MIDYEQFQQLAREFADAAEQYGKVREVPRLERLLGLRLQVAMALLDLSAPVAQQAFTAALPLVVAACMQSGVRGFPRSAVENEAFTHCLDRLTPWQPDQIPAQGFAALLLAWHAFELKFVPPIASLPAAARHLWLSFLREQPPAFAQAGDADKFVLYLRKLCERLGEYLTHATGSVADVIEAFNGSSMFIQSYFNELNLRDVMRARGAVIEQILERGGANLDQLRVMWPVRERPRIGFVSLGLGDGTETVFLAASMEHLDRRRYDVRLYSLHEPSGKVGALCRAWAETYVRLPNKIEEAVAWLRRENLDAAIFCTNLTAVTHLLTQIAAHRVARIQMSTIASPVTTGLRNMDVMISGEANETADSPEHYTERLVRLPGALNCYPFQHMLAGLADPGPISRAGIGVPEKCTLFFSAANFYKILPELSQQWIDILRQVPDSYLVLMPFNPNWSSHYPADTFVMRLTQQAAAAGLDRQRIRLLNPVPTIAHLQKITALADVYLDAFPFSGACSVYDPLVVGVPVVARGGKVCRSRHSKAILEEEGLGDWVTADGASYVQAAVAWGNDPEKRQAERQRLSLAREAGFRLSDTAAYAAKLMPALDGVVSDWNTHVDALHAQEPTQLARRIAALSSAAAEWLLSFTDQDLLVGIVLPYLRSGGSRRLIDVGACMGIMTKPFLAEGWQAAMFEPDERCHQTLTDLVNAYPNHARLEKAAITTDREGSIPFHIASLPGLSGLSTSPYAADVKIAEVHAIRLAHYIANNGWANVDFIKIDAEGHDLAILNSIDFGKVAPRLIMVEFGDHFAGQDRAAIEDALRHMQDRGYRACLVCIRAVGQFARHEWGTRLLTIAIDATPELPAGLQLFGNILFFRQDDRDFLPSLCDWLEQIVDPKKTGQRQRADEHPAQPT
jgi:FkbM family methyltransferase